MSDPTKQTTAERHEWTEGVCADGAAILCDGMPTAIPDILAALNERELLRAALWALTERCFNRCLFPAEVKTAFEVLK